MMNRFIKNGPNRLLVLWASLMLVATTLLHAQGPSEREVTPMIEQLLRLGLKNVSYNRALHDIQESDSVIQVHSANSVAEMKNFLSTSKDDLLVSGMIAIIQKLRLKELTPSLRELANRPISKPLLRLQAIRVLLLLEPDNGFSEKWVHNAIEQDFPVWNTAEQQMLISILPLLPTEKSLENARTIEAWAMQRMRELEDRGPEAVARLGEVGHIRSLAQHHIREAERAHRIEDANTKKIVVALVDEFITNYPDQIRRDRVLEVILRRNLTITVTAEARSRLDKLEKNERRGEAARLLYLLDTIGETLSDSELRQMETAFPPAPF